MVKEDEFRKLYDSGMSIPKMAEKLSVHESTIKNWANKLDLSRGKGFQKKRDF